MIKFQIILGNYYKIFKNNENKTYNCFYNSAPYRNVSCIKLN